MASEVIDDSIIQTDKMEEQLKDIHERVALLEAQVRVLLLEAQLRKLEQERIEKTVPDVAAETPSLSTAETTIGGLEAGRMRRSKGAGSAFKPIQFCLSYNLISEFKEASREMGVNQSALAEEAIQIYLNKLKDSNTPKA